MIPDFRGQTWQSLQDFPQKRPQGCSDSGFQVKTCESMQRRKVPPTVVVAATRSASDTNFLCDNREWFRLQRSMRQQGPRPILIFVAAKGNGFAYSCRSGNEVRVRFHSSLRQRRMVPPAERHYPTAAAIPDFRGQTWESPQGFPRNRPRGCSDSGFQGSNLAIAAEIARDWPSCVQ